MEESLEEELKVMSCEKFFMGYCCFEDRGGDQEFRNVTIPSKLEGKEDVSHKSSVGGCSFTTTSWVYPTESCASQPVKL